MTTPRRFPFADDPRYRWVVRLFGAGGQSSGVVVDDVELNVRFGPWRMRVPRSEITSAQVVGPFTAAKALGTRLSLADRGLTFGTTDRAGVCMTFAHPVRGIEPFGVLRHPGLTVTVEDPEALVSALGGG